MPYVLTFLILKHTEFICIVGPLHLLPMPGHSLLTELYMTGSFRSFRSQLECHFLGRETSLTTLSKKKCVPTLCIFIFCFFYHIKLWNLKCTFCFYISKLPSQLKTQVFSWSKEMGMLVKKTHFIITGFN